MLRRNRIIQAIEENSVMLWRYLSVNVPGAACLDLSGANVISFPIAHPLFNTVIRTNCTELSLPEAIHRSKEFFRERTLPWFWSVTPASRPTSLGAELVKAGFIHSHDMPGMAIDLRAYRPEAPNVAGREIRETCGNDQLRSWIHRVNGVFGLPEDADDIFVRLHEKVGWDSIPLRYFSVWSGGEPRAFSLNFTGAGVIGIYCVATVESARRQGFGEQVMHASLQAAVEEGYDSAILLSSRMGFPLYEKLGFKEFCKFGSYHLPLQFSNEQ